jgi:hypothetical protein
MRYLKRFGAAAVFAISLAIGLGVAQPAVASTRGGSPVAHITNDQVCAALTDSIAFLTHRPGGTLRDFLLAHALSLSEKLHCGS